MTGAGIRDWMVDAKMLIALPLAMAMVTVALTVLGGTRLTVGILLAAWGLLSTATSVAWWTWQSRVLPDDSEAGGGTMVAVIQLALALGATAGGGVYDAAGYSAAFTLAAAALGASALVAAFTHQGPSGLDIAAAPSPGRRRRPRERHSPGPQYTTRCGCRWHGTFEPTRTRRRTS